MLHTAAVDTWLRYHHYNIRYILDLLAMEGVGTALEGQQRKRQRSLDSSSELDGTLEQSTHGCNCLAPEYTVGSADVAVLRRLHLLQASACS
eukprot:9162-Heterococcus_DN1.PRE.6